MIDLITIIATMVIGLTIIGIFFTIGYVAIGLLFDAAGALWSTSTNIKNRSKNS